VHELDCITSSILLIYPVHASTSLTSYIIQHNDPFWHWF